MCYKQTYNFFRKGGQTKKKRQKIFGLLTALAISYIKKQQTMAVDTIIIIPIAGLTTRP